MDNLFTNMHNNNKPLPERMRPTSLEFFVGQKHLVGEGKLLNRLINQKLVANSIFWGPPGTGKTTLARIIAKTTNSNYEELNAISSGVSDAKAVIDKAKKNFSLYGTKTYLMLDECHRWTKAQSDSILSAIEEGFLIMIGCTTENPAYSMTRQIVSRSTIFNFVPLKDSDIKEAINNAIKSENGLKALNVKIDADALDYLASKCNGDLRIALNGLELAAISTPFDKNYEKNLTLEIVSECLQKPALAFNEDLSFDILSAFCKSLRGSDTEAALYYANLLIEGGAEPELIARRLIAHASEDVGMADSYAITMAVNAHYAIKNLGMPEGNIPLTHAIIYVCEAEKSNSVVCALGKAKEDVLKYSDVKLPAYLRNHTKESGNYKYPHDFGGYVEQVYMPDNLKDAVYYIPGKNGSEKNLVRKKLKTKNK